MDRSLRDAALILRCAGHGGRCNRMIGVARPIFSGESSKLALLLTNEGAAGRMDWPLLEETVPSDFSGSTGIIACPVHYHLITDKSDKSPPAFGLPGGSWARGMCVQLPFSLLHAPYRDYLRQGVPQHVMWVPKDDTALYVPDWAQRDRRVLDSSQLKIAPTSEGVDRRPWQVGPEGVRSCCGFSTSSSLLVRQRASPAPSRLSGGFWLGVSAELSFGCSLPGRFGGWLPVSIRKSREWPCQRPA